MFPSSDADYGMKLTNYIATKIVDDYIPDILNHQNIIYSSVQMFVSQLTGTQPSSPMGWTEDKINDLFMKLQKVISALYPKADANYIEDLVDHTAKQIITSFDPNTALNNVEETVSSVLNVLPKNNNDNKPVVIPTNNDTNNKNKKSNNNTSGYYNPHRNYLLIGGISAGVINCYSKMI